MATKLWTSSRLITTNLCMVENPHVSIKITLEHHCNALLKCHRSFWPQNIFTLKETVGRREGVWPPNHGHHLVSSQQICAWLEILLLLSKTLWSTAVMHYGPKKIFTLKDTVGGREWVWPPSSGHHLVSSQ